MGIKNTDHLIKVTNDTKMDDIYSRFTNNDHKEYEWASRALNDHKGKIVETGLEKLAQIVAMYDINRRVIKLNNLQVLNRRKRTK